MKPNILLIVIDSLRADHVSCYGYPRRTTPTIDRLAAEGCLFDSAISAAPFSPASYASLFSNLYPHQHGVDGDAVHIWPDNFTRLTEHLGDAGYATFGISTNSFVSRDLGGARGFDVFHEMFSRGWLARKYSGLIRRARRVFGDRLGDVLEPPHVRWPEMRAAQPAMTLARNIVAGVDRPFFGFILLMDPHAPYDRRRTEYTGDSPTVREFFRRVNSGTMYADLMARRARLSPENLRIATDLYDAEIHHADQCLGRLIDWLRQSGRLDDTLLVVTADHGEAFGEQGVWGHGFSLCDALTRVPLVVRCPHYWTAGTRSSALVQLHDVHELCRSVSRDGTPQPDVYPRCLTQAAQPDWPGRDAAFSEFPVQTGTLRLLRRLNPDFVAGAWGEGLWAVRTRQWRYVEGDGGHVALYDLQRDPGETVSVHADHPDVVTDVQHVLRQHRADLPPAASASPEDRRRMDAAIVERLQQLGYMD